MTTQKRNLILEPCHNEAWGGKNYVIWQLPFSKVCLLWHNTPTNYTLTDTWTFQNMKYVKVSGVKNIQQLYSSYLCVQKMGFLFQVD